MQIPKYIIKDIEQISRYAERMAPLIERVDDWYDKQISKYDEVDIPDEEFNFISHNIRNLKEFDIQSIKDNFRIVEEAAEETRKT